MEVTIRADRQGDHGYVVPSGAFDLLHATAVARSLDTVRSQFETCQSVDLDLAHIDHIDGTGAALLARLLDRLDASGCRTHVVEDHNPEAARLVALYRGRGVNRPAQLRRMNLLERIGAAAAELPGKVTLAFDFIGRSATALPKAIVHPRSVDWRSLPRLLQEIGANAVLVTGAANLLVGVIIGFLGVSQLGRFGAIVYVPELVVVAQFRELGPLVTAIVVAGRSGAGLASELATMKVSEEIDALRAMGFDPVRWLVVPALSRARRVVPLLTWIGDVLALVGGFIATTVITDMPPRAYVHGDRGRHHRAAIFLGGLVKTPVSGARDRADRLRPGTGHAAAAPPRSARARRPPSCWPFSA